MSRHLPKMFSMWTRLRLSAYNAPFSVTYQQSRAMRLYKERTIRSMYWRGRSFDVVKYPERRRNERQEWNYRSEIFAFSRRLQENLSEDTLRRIFAHPSYLVQLKRDQARLQLPDVNLNTNEELVLRGEQLLDRCIKPYLRYTFKRLPEEGIVSITNYLKSEPILADIAQWIGCKEIILSADYPPSPTDMANTVLALLSGIETDLGLDRVQRFIVDIIISYIHDKDIFDDIWNIPNPRETLNLILANSQLHPYEPRLMFQTGVKTIESCHLIGLYTNQKFLGSGPGETLDIAEDCAALDSLQRLFDLKESCEPMVFGEASEKIDYKAHLKEHDHISTWHFELNCNSQ